MSKYTDVQAHLIQLASLTAVEQKSILEDFSSSKLATTYNEIQELLGSGKKIKKFVSKTAGVLRIISVLKDVAEEFEHPTIESIEETVPEKGSRSTITGESGKAVMVAQDNGEFVPYATLRKRSTWFKSAKSVIRVKGKVGEGRLTKMRKFLEGTDIELELVEG
ncbi:hypothetical protein [Vibrio mediterranei]|uniref:hypothetical protein n=1 Tax=Vibrio mediterranei TaxID=689 RepID=UPI002284C234|nr:hypothetical protein [Vibrio mediterranei]MCY9855903.1 hypothetical protein [Vibrio mediterranei]